MAFARVMLPMGTLPYEAAVIRRGPERASQGAWTVTRGNGRKGTFIAVANMKGGVGKTTTVVGLAEFLALERGASVLVVDLDQQASASLCTVGDAMLSQLMQGGRTVDAFLKARLIENRDGSLPSRIRRNSCNLLHEGRPVFTSLLPSSPQLRIVERDLLVELTRRGLSFSDIVATLAELFAQDFGRLRVDFDYVLFDCAPGISPLTEVAINASDLVLIPTIPDRLSAFGLYAFMENIVRRGAAPDARELNTKVLFTRVQSGVAQHEHVRASLRAKGQFAILATEIAQNATLAAGIFPDDAPLGAPPVTPTVKQKYGAAAEQYRALVAELVPAQAK